MPGNLKQTLANALVMHKMFRHTGLIRMAGHTMATPSLEFMATDAPECDGFDVSALSGRFASTPIEVTGNSPPPPKYPVGVDQPRVNAGSPAYPLDVSAALMGWPTESVQRLG
jgi:alpha-L-arabinofuranosidase